jgi:uncharacterized protein YaiL (DUF2058 family)
MGDSLRDQLLKSGIVKQVRDEQRAPSSGKGRRPQADGRARQRERAKGSDEIDLARAYAMRAQTEATERKRAEQEAAEKARIKRERRAQVQKLLAGNVLNKADAEQARHFEYGGKIRRIYVDAAQLAALNAGELGVVQQAGRYLLVTRELLDQVAGIDPEVVALRVEPGSSGTGDDGVPDDLIW